MAPGMRITVNAPAGIMTITAKDDLVRAYTWEGATRSVEMIPREERWYGSLGLYYPGPGDHWKEHHGITRGVLEEGQQHFKTTAEARKWLRTSQLIYRDDGLAASWSKELGRRQLGVSVWQIYVAGKKPAKLSGSQNGKIAVKYGPIENSPLVQAVVRKDLKTVQALLDGGANVKAADAMGRTALHWAASSSGSVSIAGMLVTKGAEVDSRDWEGTTPLMDAAMVGQVDLVIFLIDSKANVNACNDATRKKYRAAQFVGDTVTQKDIEKSGKLNTRQEDGDAVLDWASVSGNKQIIAALKAAGAKGADRQ
ncbi:MAG: Ankyrin repeat protein [Chthonomonadales bacterium]|nr:Ankyrin repeat protein [Chthonomonadales bacterium]